MEEILKEKTVDRPTPPDPHDTADTADRPFESDNALLAALLDDPEALEQIGREAANPPPEDEGAGRKGDDGHNGDQIGGTSQSGEDLLKNLTALPELLRLAAPLFRQAEQKGGGRARIKSDCSERNALLLAVKPYVSPARRERIDALVRLGKLTDLIQKLFG